jgi:phosphoglycolate phosphatase
MLQYKAVIFDLDGTLIHSAPDIQAAANVALKAINRGPLDLPATISFIGDGVETFVGRCLQSTGGMTTASYDETLGLFLESYTQNMTTLTQPYPGVVSCLERLRAGNYRLGICTNKLSQAAKDICDDLGLTGYFDIIAGAEPDLPKKPDPTPLLRCISELGGEVTNSLYVGDSVVDYKTAVNANVPFRLFTGGYLNGAPPRLAAEAQFDDWTTDGVLNLSV